MSWLLSSVAYWLASAPTAVRWPAIAPVRFSVAVRYCSRLLLLCERLQIGLRLAVRPFGLGELVPGLADAQQGLPGASGLRRAALQFADQLALGQRQAFKQAPAVALGFEELVFLLGDLTGQGGLGVRAGR